MKDFFKVLLFLSLSLIIFPGYSQSSKENALPLQLFDQTIRRENTGLANGEEYIEPHIVKDDQHKYFLSPAFLEGQVKYDGQSYSHVSLKYNVYDDVLLIFLNTSDGNSSFQLHKEKIDSFKINEHAFINVSTQKKEGTNGFFEILLNLGHTLLLKKHSKKLHKELDKNFTYYRFEEKDPEYVIFHENKYFPVEARRDFLKIFPEKETIIRDFFRNNKPLKKSRPDQFMKELLQKIEN